MREVTLAATQMACDWNREENVANAIDLAPDLYRDLLTLDGETPPA